MSGVGLVAITLLLGWTTLWGVRRHLGAAGYHAAALPVGMLLWLVPVLANGLLRSPWGWLSWLVLVGGAVAASFGLRALAGDDPRGGRAPSWWTFAAVGTATAVAALVTAWAGAFFVTFDSWSDYGPLGLRLHDVGALLPRILEQRSPIVPSLHAGAAALGADWLFAIYPVVALWTCGLLTFALWRHAFARLTTPARIAGTAALTLGMATGAMFLLQALYVHSHMVTACYLLLAFVAIAEARERGSSAWLAVAGLGTAGVALARPDGLTYCLVPTLVAAWLVWFEARPPMRLAPFLASLWVPLAVTFGTAYLTLGVWPGAKLNGRVAALSLAAIAVAPLVVRALRPVAARMRIGASAALLGALGVTWAGIAAYVVWKLPASLSVIRIMALNLLWLGHYGPQWYIALAAMALALAAPCLRRRSPVIAVLTFAIGEFMAAAVVIHVSAHAGHTGWTDSFNRIAFHAVPLVWWLLGALVGAALVEAGWVTVPEPDEGRYAPNSASVPQGDS